MLCLLPPPPHLRLRPCLDDGHLSQYPCCAVWSSWLLLFRKQLVAQRQQSARQAAPNVSRGKAARCADAAKHKFLLKVRLPSKSPNALSSSSRPRLLRNVVNHRNGYDTGSPLDSGPTREFETFSYRIRKALYWHRGGTKNSPLTGSHTAQCWKESRRRDFLRTREHKSTQQATARRAVI